MNEINDYLSKADKDIAKNVMYRVYGMPGPLFVENEITPEPKPKPSFDIPFYVENITNETETLTIAGYDWREQGNYLEFPVEYSIDNKDWELLGTTGETPLTWTLQPGDRVYLRATRYSWCEEQVGCCIFGISKVGGNIMSLLYGSSFTGNETSFPSDTSDTLVFLFADISSRESEDNVNLRDASELILPATTLTETCYDSMFSHCTTLTTAPKLPATTLAENCYGSMFSGCTSLTVAPQLPATILSSSCYANMFNSCTSLTTASQLPATTLASSCYESMFNNCSSLTVAPVLPATTLTDSCYSNMFSNCTSLTTAPQLLATTLTEYCYAGMFSECTSLTVAPQLPATTLAENCYECMFNSCTSLNDVTIYANDVSASNCLDMWLNNVSGTGNFHNLGTAIFEEGSSGCPGGWTADHPEYINIVPPLT